MDLSTLFQSAPTLALLVWILAWKGLALWNAAKNNQKNWFIVIFIINGLTIGILEIIYLFRFAKKRMVLSDLYFWKSKKV